MANETRERLTAEKMRERFNWQKVHTPHSWDPRDIGEELIGYYGGRTLRSGQFGQYEVALIHVPYRGTYTVTGTQVIQLLDAAMIQRGHPIRIIWKGWKQLQGDKEKKQFELLVAEGEPLEEADLPEVRR